MSRTALRAAHAAQDRLLTGAGRPPAHPADPVRPGPAVPAAARPVYPGPAPDAAKLSAWQRRLELDDQVRAAAAAVVESPMPQLAGPAGRGAVLRAGALVAAALAVAAGYIGLPLALAARSLLGALPQALVLATAIVVLGTVGVLAVLRRTALAVPPTGPGRRDSLRHGAGSERPSGRTAPPDRRALPHAGRTAPPHRRATLHGAPPHPAPPASRDDLAAAWATSAPAAGRHRTAQGARRSRHGARRR